MKVLVTGGAGYIGSFMTNSLIDNGHEVVVFDSLERGHREAVDDRAEFFQGDIKKNEDLEILFEKYKFDALMHFAAYIAVGESEEEPEKYYDNNVRGSENLFNYAIKNGIDKIIFSSSAAVYGNPDNVPIPENHPKRPTSEYGKNKLDMEECLSRFKKNNPDLGFACLRYFNAAGASLDGIMGEAHNPETHIIPLAIKAVLKNSEFRLFGTDYDTPDGTCIRDYIHVLDLVEAHVLALNKITTDKQGYFYNVGTGSGYSNREVLDMVEKISGKKISIIDEERRSGDADKLIADPTSINNELGFSPRYSDLQTIVESAYKWHNK